MPYDQKIIEQVQSLNDIVDVISGYIPLKRAGRSLKANCPFHQEKTPSFIVNPERQIYHCFGCGEGGDVISFVMKYEQLSFPEALKQLAERAHIELPETNFQGSGTDKTKADLVYKACEEAGQFYHANFLKAPEAEKARQYWKSRGFGEKEAREFGIGYAFDDWRELLDFLTAKGFREDLLLRSGLIARSPQGKFYDWFRGRLIFPIRSVHGRVIAFGGRVFGNETPKYLNSPETEIFKKRKEFYGLHLARSSRALQGDIRRMIVVEGYMDCLQLQANGFLNTVATLGTAMSEDHVRILRRYADEAIVLYDGDRAGEQAALRGLDIFLEEGLSAKAVSLPDGLDPDDFLRQRGSEALQREISSALDIFDFKLNILSKRFNKDDSSGLLKITNEFLETLAKVKSRVLLDQYLNKLAAALSVEERSLRAELDDLMKKHTGQAAFMSHLPRQEKNTPSGKSSVAGFPHERLLLACMFQSPAFFFEFGKHFSEADFQDPQARDFFGIMSKWMEKFESTFAAAKHSSSVQGPVNQFVTELRQSRPELGRLASEFLAMELPQDQDQLQRTFLDCVRKLQQVLVDKRLKEIQVKIQQAERQGNRGLVDQLVSQYQELLTASKASTSKQKVV